MRGRRIGIASVLVALPGCYTATLDLRSDAADAAHDGSPDAPGVPASCEVIHVANPSAPTGTYTIAPGGSAPLTATCDMTTAGGGWTIVYLAPATNLTTGPIAYTTQVLALLATAHDALMVYRTASLAPLAGAATFALPAGWRTDTPFDYTATDVPVMVSIDGATAAQHTLRYGQQNFANYCTDPWVANFAYGRVCIENTTAPFYSAFVYSAGDWCANSNVGFQGPACSADRRFSIAVR
jgi:hypothetical protein